MIPEMQTPDAVLGTHEAKFMFVGPPPHLIPTPALEFTHSKESSSSMMTKVSQPKEQ